MVGTVPNTEEEARNEFKRITGIMAVGVAGTYRPQVVKLAQSAQRGERLWLAVRAAIEQYAPDLEAVKEAIEIYEYERTANE